MGLDHSVACGLYSHIHAVHGRFSSQRGREARQTQSTCFHSHIQEQVGTERRRPVRDHRSHRGSHVPS